MTFSLEPQTVPQYHQVQFFSFGSNTCKIADAISILETLREEYYCTELELNFPSPIEMGDLSFYGVKRRLETPSEVLKRHGITDHDEKVKLLKVLKDELGM